VPLVVWFFQESEQVVRAAPNPGAALIPPHPCSSPQLYHAGCFLLPASPSKRPRVCVWS